MSLAPSLPVLKALTASNNHIRAVSKSLHGLDLIRLDLSFNEISSIKDIAPLSAMPNLSYLSLRSNPIVTLGNHTVEFPSLKYLDVASTLLPTLASLDPIRTIFPHLISLLTKDSPLSEHPSATLLTIARIATLTELNYSPITPAERQNAELYYMSNITKELSEATNPAKETQILASHPRWTELCAIYGKPDISCKKQETEAFRAGTLGARVAKFIFVLSMRTSASAKDLPPSPMDEKSSQEIAMSSDSMDLDRGDKEYRDLATDEAAKTSKSGKIRSRLLPTTASIYHLMGIAASLFSLRPSSIRLVLETDEFDPVGEEDGEWSVSEDDSSEDEAQDKKTSNGGKREKGSWVRREEILIGSTRSVGNWLPVGFGGKGAEVRLRVEDA